MDPKGKINTFDDVMRANLALFDYILLDENIQVNGLVFMIDLTGFSRHHFLATGMENTKRCMIVTQVSLPHSNQQKFLNNLCSKHFIY